MEQHKLRGWATVWRVTTAEGGWFAKQNCPGQQVEVPLMEALARLAPDRVVPVTAARDGFLLTPDQGPVFDETAGDDLENWVRLARDAALLQRELVPHHDELTGVGMTELRPTSRPTTWRPASSSTPRSPPATRDGWRTTSPRACARTCPSYDGGPRRSPRSGCR